MNPRPGDIIGFKRMFFTHYGIFIGNGLIVHRDKSHGRPSVAISQLSDVPGSPFIANDQYTKTPGLRRIDTEEVIDKAIEKIGETDYNLITANCEHFVTQHKYNKSVSHQVSKVRNISALTGLLYMCVYILKIGHT